MNAEQLCTVKQAAERIPGFTESTIRYHIFHAAENGWDELGVLRRIGRRVYVDLDALGKWIDNGAGR